mgnify:CR=1 FL=1
MNDVVESLLLEILENQRKSERFLHFLTHQIARELINKNLTKPIELRVYDLSDGILSSRDIEKIIGKKVTQRTVVTWWQKWKQLGLVEHSPRYSGRVRKLIPLEDLGIEIPAEEDDG